MNILPAITSNTTINGYKYIDLGLSSGLKWATCNIGANSPEEYGEYYAWGETEIKNEYSTDNCLTFAIENSDIKCNSTITIRTPLCTIKNKANDISGNSKYDVARKKWGGPWRMPTYQEFAELITECNCEWIEFNGIGGRLFTGPNDNSIFLPAAGFRLNVDLGLIGENGCYMSSMAPDDTHQHYYKNFYAYCLEFGVEYQRLDYGERYHGCSIRPITE